MNTLSGATFYDVAFCYAGKENTHGAGKIPHKRNKSPLDSIHGNGAGAYFRNITDKTDNT